MGDEDFTCDDTRNCRCGYQSERRDCDGDWDTYCTKMDVVNINTM